MAVCDVVSEYARLRDALWPTVFSIAADAGALSNAVAFTLGMTLGATGNFSDHVTQYAISTAAEHGSLADGHDQTGRFSNSLRANGRMRDGTSLTFQSITSEHAILADAVFDSQPARAINDSGTLGDSISPAVLRMTVVGGGHIAERILPNKGATLSDDGELADNAVQSVRIVDVITERGTFFDAVTSGNDTCDVLRDAIRGAESFEGVLHAVSFLAEHATVSDMAMTELGGAWTAPLDTFAMSRWETQPFNSIAEIDGVLYAASDDGLYRLSAQHQEAPIEAVIRGGMTDIGSPALKRASYYYAGYQSDGTLAVTVGCVPVGEEQSFTYALPARPAAAPTPGRTKLGRGMRSRYWRFTIENVEGSDFTIFDQRLIVENTTRRI